ncbi:MAG TPA: SIS domain-containing protein [Candidatus Hydrogenedentes bacterium]|jgi:D-sedoheptulose 7-phosphate isomerase|nr:MAG: Phosphoheptose isomerase [Candidatus Hydrogenedentes bacterium ADurb.Bin170]HNZ47983.1 SIS domain-containing protein [Candidatus Hydrogenedentota bacterium]HOD94283.1 SIS domain-containing protein [Candidatus Hydrogenedentota bacterium]HOH41614.1 SIS domain-containing protein [Candidatus Hydrogenedentota bacterium]HOM48671.1 SIS domain-containing protein [Candidatus Hydrogenedentota bacterium]
MNKIAELFAKAGSIQEYAKLYNARLSEVLASLDWDSFAKAVTAFEEARQSGKAIYVMGNGGSAASCAHLVNDLIAGAYLDGKPAFRAVSLADNLATVTALANDSGYESIFVHQLKVLLRPGDLVLAMSVSGNSPNILRALEYAKSEKAVTVGFCGLTGGAMKNLCDVVIHADTTLDEYGPVEDVFSILGHILAGYLSMKQGKMLHH